jgi:hypothetical protein
MALSQGNCAFPECSIAADCSDQTDDAVSSSSLVRED